MSYLLLWLGFAIWVFVDSRNRRMGKSVLWAIGTQFAGVLVLPMYFAKRNLFAGEVREGGAGWNAVKVFALYWTITMFVAGMAGMGAASREVATATSSAGQAGAAIGSMLGLGLLLGVWFAVLAGALVIGLFLKKSSIVESGPTGELAGQDASPKKLGVWMLAVWLVVACVGVLVSSTMKGSDMSVEKASINSDKLAELSAMPAAPLSPTGELATMFNLMSDSTDLQRENKLKEIKGKVVEWTLPVYEVRRDGNNYKVQTTAGEAVGAFVYISSRNDQDKAAIEALKTGSLVSIKGIIKEDSVRHLVIKPAILFQAVSHAVVQKEPSLPPARPEAEQSHPVQAAQQSNSVCAEIYKQEETKPGDNDVSCSNLELKIADDELNAAYRSVMSGLAPDRKAALKAEQLTWIKGKEKRCSDAASGAINFRQEALSTNQCLIEMTTDRIAKLKAFQ